jgi:CDGSH-type Zn-finger protein
MSNSDQPGAGIGSEVTATISIRFRENGPAVIDLPPGAHFELDGQTRVLDRAKLALCRCGHSACKPLCDGSHKQFGFRAFAGIIVVPTTESTSRTEA